METNGQHFDEDMGVNYTRGGLETSGSFDQEKVADAIIDNANIDNEDKTGKEGADAYTAAVQNLPDPQYLRGSLPTYRAEAKYILGGVVGNYEKSLENSAAAGLSTNGRADPRSVANLIVNSAYTSVRDCTGSTDSTGAHGPGIGMPPCPFSTVFAQGRCPTNMQIRQGEFVSNQDQECTCIPGFYGPNTNGPCELCAVNNYCPGGATLTINYASPQLPCPAHSTAGAGSSQCICGAGYVGNPVGTPPACASCPNGQYCPGDGLSFNCKTGFVPTADQTACVIVCTGGQVPSSDGQSCVTPPPPPPN